MSYKVYKDCILTHKDSKVIKDYNYKSHPYVTLDGGFIYSPCYGLVVQICNYEDSKRIILEYNPYIYLSFTNVDIVGIELGQAVNDRMILGYSKNLFNFELLISKDIATSPFRVIINKDISLYKVDPTSILDRSFKFFSPE